MVRIRLRRVGRKAQPYYRVVVADSATPRDGYYLDTVGFYNPRTRPAELRMDLVKVDEWVSKGAGMSTTVASLVRKARRGGDDSVAGACAGRTYGHAGSGGVCAGGRARCGTGPGGGSAGGTGRRAGRRGRGRSGSAGEGGGVTAGG
jgi:small subunit ribosomal protein S16